MRHVASGFPIRGWSEGQAVIAATVAATALAFSLQVVSFLDVKNLALWLGVATLWSVQWARGRRSCAGFRVLGPCWCALALLFCCGFVVASAKHQLLVESLRISGLLLFASLAYPELQGAVPVRRLLSAVVVSALVCAAAGFVQWLGIVPGLLPEFPQYDQPMYSVFGNQGHLGGYLALGIVAALGLARLHSARIGYTHMALLFTGAGVLFIMLVLTGSRAGLLAAVAGILSLAGVQVLQWRHVAVIGAIGLAGWLLFGVLAHPGIGAKWVTALSATDSGGIFRCWAWRACLDMVLAHPMQGVGLGNFAYEAPPYLGALASTNLGELTQRTTYHAHNDLLEFAVETGAIGLVLLAWVFSRVRVRRPAAFSCAITMAVFSLVYPLWSSTPHALLFLLMLAVNLPRPGKRRSRRGHFEMAGALSVLGGMVFASMVFYPSLLLRGAEDLHLAGVPARAAYERATNAPGASAEAFESFGIYLLEREAYRDAWMAFETARQGLNTGRVFHLSGMAAEGRGERGSAIVFYEACLARWPHARAVRERHRQLLLIRGY